MPNTVTADVTAFLKKNNPKAYCDNCIAAVKAKRRQQATGPLEAAGCWIVRTALSGVTP